MRPPVRIAVEAVVLVVVAVACGSIGLAVASEVLEAAVRRTDLDSVTITSPTDPYVAYARIGLAFAAPALGALGVMLAFVLGARRPAPRWLAPVALLALAALAAAGFGYQWLGYAALAAMDDSFGPSIAGYVSLDGLDVGGTAIRFDLWATLALAGLAFGLAHRARRDAAPRPG